MDDSPIHGKVLFARHHIKAGEINGIIDGIPPRPTASTFSGWTGKMESMFNASCDLSIIVTHPNAVYYDTLEVCALTDIKPGEEITHNYMGVCR